MKIFALLFFYCGTVLAQVAPVSPVPDETTLTADQYELDQAEEQFSLTKYFPVYLLYGDPLTKLQFSFKYQLLKDLPLYFGYTQLVFWDLGADSKPIDDVNYGPEVFYRQSFDNKILKSIDFSPLSHFSNGLAGPVSRGYNRIYAQLNMDTPFFNDTLKITARFSYLYDLDDGNPNIMDNVGPVDFKFTFTKFFPGILDRGELYFRVFPGGQDGQYWANGGQEIGLSFRLGRLDVAPSLFIQYYGGYAESLLYYAQPESTTRFGILF